MQALKKNNAIESHPTTLRKVQRWKLVEGIFFSQRATLGSCNPSKPSNLPFLFFNNFKTINASH